MTAPYGQFTEGRRTGETYIQFVDEKVIYPYRTNIDLLDTAVIWTTRSVTKREGNERESTRPK